MSVPTRNPPEVRCNRLRKRRRKGQHGLSLLELLLAILLTVVVVVAVQNLLLASWRSADDLIWQNWVNQEARQALDEMCDAIRSTGDNIDLIAPTLANYPQVGTGNKTPVSNAVTLTCIPTHQDFNGGFVNYELRYSQALKGWYLVRTVRGAKPDEETAIASYVDNITFEYEYRLPANNGSSGWILRRVANPNDPSLASTVPYLVSTIYVTVEASVSPYGPAGMTYRRRMTSAVHPRAPYNETVPPAQRGISGQS